MTTIVGIKIIFEGKPINIIGADTQLTAGHIKYPFEVSKVERVGEKCLMASSGSVGDLQNFLSIITKNILIDKITNNETSLEISAMELARAISELSFGLNLEYKNFSSFGVIIADEKDLISVDSSGSIIPIPTYTTEGSGYELSLSILNNGYREDLSKEEAGVLVYDALKSASKSDIYTSNNPQVFQVSEEGILKFELKQRVVKKPKTKKVKVDKVKS